MKSKETNKKNYENITITMFFILISIMYVVIQYFINKTYKETNNLALYLIHFILSTVPYIVVFFIAVLVENKTKFIIKGILILTLVWPILECFYIPRKYDYIKINGEEQSMSSYKYAIFKDVIANKTTTINISDKDIIPKEDEVYTGLRHRRETKRRYICFKKDNNEYVSESTKTLNNIINEVKRINSIRNLEIKITIEYYNNSGIIKTIEGVNLHDYKGIANKLSLLIEQKIQEIENKNNEAEKLKQEEQEIKKKKEAALIKVKQNAIGKQIENIKKELEENEISEYSIKYISSKLYSVGSVVFVDKNKTCFYVVKDNKKEDMVKMPNIEPGMTKDEVMKKLNKSGLNGYVDMTSKAYNNEKSGTLKYYNYSPGTLLPKGLEVSFSIYE